jgi:hypothetical protein
MKSRGLHFDPAMQQVYEQLLRMPLDAHGADAGEVHRSGNDEDWHSPARGGGTSPVDHAGADIPQAHPGADPDAAYRLNMDYQRRIAEWNALSWWQRRRTPRPEPPQGI